METTAQLQERVVGRCAAADAVVMAAAPADFRPARRRRRQDQEVRGRQRAGDPAHPEPRHPGRAGRRPAPRRDRGRRLRRGDRGRQRHRHGPRPGQARPQGVRPARGQRRRRRGGVRLARTTRRSCSRPTASADRCRCGSKSALAHVIWDRVLACCARTPPRPATETRRPAAGRVG